MGAPNDLLGISIHEGVEDALSAHETTGLGGWASGGAAFLPNLADAVPTYVETITVVAHRDEAGGMGCLGKLAGGRPRRERLQCSSDRGA